MARGAPAATRRGFPADPGEVVDDVLAAEWHGRRRPAAAPGRLQRRRLATARSSRAAATRGRSSPPCSRSSASTRRRSRPPSRRCPRSRTRPSTTGRRAQAEERRERECFALSDEDADAARAFGCLLELPGPNGRGDHRYVTDPRVARGSARRRRSPPTSRPRRSASSTSARRRNAARRRRRTTPRSEARREQRQRDYEARVSARARNLDLGAALARWQPKLDTDAVKLLGSLVLLHTARRRPGRTGSASSSRRRRTSRAR